jgi:hypothetical protein
MAKQDELLTFAQKKHLHRIITEFQKKFCLEQFKLDNLILINDYNTEDAGIIANIAIDLQYKSFTIRMWLGGMGGNFETAQKALVHELTHLFLYDMLAYYEMLVRHNADNLFRIEAHELYETVTYRLSPYLETLFFKQPNKKR